MAATEGGPGKRRIGAVAAGIGALASSAAAADTSLDFKFLRYGESDGRTQVNNPELYLLQDFGERGQLGLLLAYDSISGASPTGEAPTLDAASGASSSGSIPMVDYNDTREAASVSYSRRFGSHLPSVTLSYSHESDYVSRGASLAESWDLFGGRSTVHFGIGGTDDIIEPVTLDDRFTKKSLSFAAGWTQVMGPRDLLDISFGLENLDGYLTDPYKLVTVGATAFPEIRPDSRIRRTAVLKYGHYFVSRSALKTSYRYYRDDWDIKSQTLDLSWDKRIGRRFILSPRLRYYQQGAASFFAYEFDSPEPYMSSDYRLSSFWSWLGGLGCTVEVNDHFSFNLEAAYLDQTGNDRVKPRAAAALPLAMRPGLLEDEEEDEDDEGEGGGGNLSAADLQTITATFGFSIKF